MVLLPDSVAASSGTSDPAKLLRHAFALTRRLVLTVVPAAVVYFLGLTTFWGGFVFFVVAESIRWLGTTVVASAARWRGASAGTTNEILRPLIELAAIAVAPLFSLAILLSATAPLLNRGVQTELIHSFVLYLCYLPYGILSWFVFPLFESRR
jgi:hypothetical protein